MPSSQGIKSNSDGGQIQVGIISRILTWLGANITLTGSGSNVYTLPNSTTTLAGLGVAQTFTQPQTFTGGITATGTATNDNAAAGYIGEFISSNVPIGSAVSVTSAQTLTVTSISLTAGDWDVWGNVGFIAATGTIPSLLIVSINNGTAATLPTAPNSGAYAQIGQTFNTASTNIMPTGRIRVSLTTTTNIYLVAQATFTVSTLTAYGFIGARRMR